MTKIGLNFNTTNMLGLMQMFGGSSYGTNATGIGSIFNLLSIGCSNTTSTGTMVGSLLSQMVLNYAPQILGNFIGGVTSAVQASKAQKAETAAQAEAEAKAKADAEAKIKAESEAKAEQVTKEEQATLNKNDIRNKVIDILNSHKIVASDETIEEITNKYPTMQAIQVGNLSVEDRVVNLARGLESQRQFELISTTITTNEYMLGLQEDLIKSGINSEEIVNNMLKAGTITQEEADSYIQALNFKPAETPEPIVLDAVNEALEAGSQEQFNNAYLQYAREQIETYDTNDDGFVQFDEFEKVEKEKAGELYDELSTKAIFDTINQNGDDKIDATEMASLIWATSKINDTETSKSAGDITANEIETLIDNFAAISLGIKPTKFIETLKNGYEGFSAQ